MVQSTLSATKRSRAQGSGRLRKMERQRWTTRCARGDEAGIKDRTSREAKDQDYKPSK